MSSKAKLAKLWRQIIESVASDTRAGSTPSEEQQLELIEYALSDIAEFKNTEDITSENSDGVFFLTQDVIGDGTAEDPQYPSQEKYVIIDGTISSFSNASTGVTTNNVSIDANIQTDGALKGLNAPTWSVVDGKIINTPNGTPFAVVDSSLEIWSDDNNLTNWSKYIPSGGTLEKSTDANTGSFSAKIISTGGRIDLSQNLLIPVGNFYNVRAFGKSNSVTNKVLRWNCENQLSGSGVEYLSDVNYTEMVNTAFRKTASGKTTVQNLGNSGAEFNVDDITVNLLDKNSIFATTKDVGVLKQTKAFCKSRLNTLTGIVVNLDNPENPQNYLLLVRDTTNALLLWKCVKGVTTQVSSVLVHGNQSNYADGLIELRQISLNKYQQYFDGNKEGDVIDLHEPTINLNGHHGIFSTYSENTIEYFSCNDFRDNVVIPNGADFNQYCKYVSKGDTLTFAKNGTYIVASDVKSFDNLPTGELYDRITININNATIDGSDIAFYLENKQHLVFKNFALVNTVQYFSYLINGTNNIIFENGSGLSDEPTFRDGFKNRSHITKGDLLVTNIGYRNCSGTCTDGYETSDFGEDWGTRKVIWKNCHGYNFKNGILNRNNGHGFEAYAGNTAVDEHCEDIAWVDCTANGNRVGFSSEGGVPGVNNINVIAINCNAYDNEIADAGGVNGATLLVDGGNLVVREGSVIDI